MAFPNSPWRHGDGHNTERRGHRGSDLGPKSPCSGCPRASILGSRGGMSKEKARTSLQRLQSIIGLLLFLSSGVAVYLLATDRSLWLLAVSHAVGLIVIAAVDLGLGVLSFASSRRAYVPSMAVALLGFVLQLGDVFTAPQYGLTITYFADYLFGLWAFDVLIALQLAVLFVGVIGRPYAISLARRKTGKGRELNLSKRSFLTSLVAIASMVGLGVLVSSIKLPAGTPQTTTSLSGITGAIANNNSLQVGAAVQFDYPVGYPNVLFKKSDGSLMALSLLCTHDCCVSTYDPASNKIYCPCHGSVFDANGHVLQGPASSPLPQVQLRVDASGNVFPTGISNPGPCHV